MELKEILDAIRDLTPAWVVKFLVFGSDETNIKFMYFKNKSMIRINKHMHSYYRQIEFVWRIFVLNFLWNVINCFILLKFESYLTWGILGLLSLEFIFNLWFILYRFKKHLIGFSSTDYQRRRKLELPLYRFEIMFFVIGAVIYVLPVRLNIKIAFQMLFLAIMFAAVCIYTDFKRQKLRKYDIVYAHAKSDIDIGDAIDPEKDISIKMKNGTIRKINLNRSNIYICDNDDIWIVTPKEKNANMETKENDIKKIILVPGIERRETETGPIKIIKDTIQSINIKNEKIAYKNGKWELEK